jgi:hypothetical protein
VSEPAIFVLIRDGKKSFYMDRWAAVFLHREIFWGPDELEKWVSQRDQVDEWTDDVSGGAVVDFDRRQLVWTGDTGELNIPRAASAYDRMLRAAWPGYDIRFATTGVRELAEAAGFPYADEYDSQLQNRPETVRNAAGLYDDGERDETDEEDEDDQETGDSYHDEASRAWSTLVDVTGVVRHRQIESLSQDLLTAVPAVIDAAITLKAAEIPPEKVVSEGMWIDQKKREIGLWGSAQTHYVLPTAQNSWSGWSVKWADNGYSDQCRISGPSGVPMSDIEALAQFLPTILSTKRLDLQNIIGAMGGHLKKTAMKLTGCLLAVICSPVLLFGLLSGNWKAALITIAVVTAVVIFIFKMIEFRLKRSVSRTLPSRGHDPDDDLIPVAGPLDEKERRRRVDELLAATGFPPLAKVEPSFPKVDPTDLLN